MKVSKKIISFVVLVLILVPYFSFAADVESSEIENVKINATPETSEDGKLTNEITNVDNENKEVTLQMKLDVNDKTENNNTEIILLIDNSSSMNENVEGSTRKNKVLNAAKNLVRKINTNNSNAKISIMQFSDRTSVVQDFTTDGNALINKIDSMKTSASSGATNLASALSSAKKKFSSAADNKMLVILTDGEPTDGDDATRKQLSDSNVYIISTLVGINDKNKEKIQKIFGTEQNPTSNKLYNVDDGSIASSITNTIYNKVANEIEGEMNQVEITQELPEYITDNFDVSVQLASVGTARVNNDKLNWNISNVGSSDDAYLTYKLALKDGYDESILDTILDTDKKVEMAYVNTDGKSKNKTLSDSPQIKLATTNVPKTNEEKKNEVNIITTSTAPTTKNKISVSTSSKKIPYTGSNSKILIAIVLVSTIAIILKIKINKIK